MATRSYLTPEVATGEADARWIDRDADRRRPRRGLHWPQVRIVPGLEARPLTVPDALHHVRRELARSRRFERPFALVRFGATTHSWSLLENVREVDIVWIDRGRVFAVLPEADRSAGSAFVRRLEAAGLGSGAAGDSSVAVFPDDGLTTDALFAAVERRACLVPDRRTLIPLGGRSAR